MTIRKIGTSTLGPYFLVMLRLAGAALGFVVSLRLSHQNPVLFASFSVLLILSILFATVATLGFDILLVRELSGPTRFVDVSRRDLVGFCIVASVLCATIVSGAMLMCIEHFYGTITGVGFGRIALAIMLQCCCRLTVPILRVSERFVAAQLVESVLQQAVLVGAVLLLVHRDSSVAMVFDCFIAATGIAALYGIWSCRQLVRGGLGTMRPIRRAHARYFAVEAVVFLGSTLLLMLNSRIDILYVGRMLDPTRFGAYRIAAQVFELSGIVSSTFLATYASRIVQLLRQRDVASIERILLPATRLNAALMTAGAVLASIIGRPIVATLFPLYPDLYGLVVVFLLFRSLSLLCPSGSTLLDLADRQRMSLMSMILSFAVLCLLLPPVMGSIGMYGVAGLVGMILVIRNVVTTWLAKRYAGVGTTVFG